MSISRCTIKQLLNTIGCILSTNTTRIELFSNSKVYVFVIIKIDMIHGYLGYNTIAIHQQLMGIIASLIKELSGKSTSVIYCTHCINKAVLFSGNNDIDHISEVFNSLDGQMK
jgi:hypothetical protein